jgi:hypothetical protein
MSNPLTEVPVPQEFEVYARAIELLVLLILVKSEETAFGYLGLQQMSQDYCSIAMLVRSENWSA